MLSAPKRCSAPAEAVRPEGMFLEPQSLQGVIEHFAPCSRAFSQGRVRLGEVLPMLDESDYLVISNDHSFSNALPFATFCHTK